MVKVSVILAAWLALPVLFGGEPALAQSGEYRAGPYRLRVALDRERPQSARDFYLTVEQLDQGRRDWRLKVEAIPRTRSAIPVTFDGDFSTTDPAKRLVKLQIPISGDWTIELKVQDGSTGWTVSVPVKVDPPPVLPYWLAWLIGFTPIIGLIGFGLGQWRMVNRRRAEHHQAAALHEAQPGGQAY